MAAQFFVFDSIRVSIWFSPLAYIAFVALLPLSTRPVSVLLLGFLAGVFVDFFEGTAGVHTASTLASAYMRTWILRITIGRETAETEMAMPSIKLLGQAKFFRYAALLVFFHCLVFFTLEALTWTNFHWVLIRTGVSAFFTLFAVWTLSLLFTVKKYKRA
jgi:hypothetical protein